MSLFNSFDLFIYLSINLWNEVKCYCTKSLRNRATESFVPVLHVLFMYLAKHRTKSSDIKFEGNIHWTQIAKQKKRKKKKEAKGKGKII